MSNAERDLRSIWAFLDRLAFTHGYVDAAGTKTRYVNAGPKDAPVVVMVHGMGGTWENFIANFAEFSKSFNTYAFDLKGHGYSDKPDEPYAVSGYVEQLEGFVKALGLTKIHLFGLSIGGWISTKFTVRNPGLVEKLIVMSAWGRLRLNETEEERQNGMQFLAQRAKSVENPSLEKMDKVFSQLIADPEQRMLDLLTLRMRVYSQPNMVRTMENVFAGIMPPLWEENVLTDEELKSISRPTMIIACPDSEDEFLVMAHQYRSLIPDVEWCEVFGASHWPQWETADQVNAASIEFLKG
ncbi:alpha/beta hydrolase [Sphingorhabdus sp. YGSMI21]|uniref:alpha/beta fold hydrolase n=1 Tax=Sphingorhabdus sp. YGSMI21 TaxID=2077182 RepID=UPI0013D9BA47|nr:alpha/beta hydrolase [Sphingorhabdus sp. YGSMI21]